MSRSVKLHLGINGSFCARRWEQPENWMRLTSELGYGSHELCTDLIDPFFAGDRDFQRQQARAAKSAADTHGVTVCGVSTGMVTECFHGLSHTDPLPRQRVVDWIAGAMDIATQLGARWFGGRWDVIPSEAVEAGEEKYKDAVRRQHEIWRDITQIARDKGLARVYQEQGCTPSEAPCTIKQAEEFLIQTNRKNNGSPVYLGINVGHMAGMHYGLEGRSLSYTEWLQTLAPFAPVIHLQQTTPDASHYWPFTEAYNKIGHVDVAQVVEAIRYAHDHYEQSWVSEVLEPVDECWLVVQTRPEATKTETTILDELRETAEYLKQWLPDGVLELSF